MLNCDEFQLLAGADPEHLSWAQKLHRLTCRGCARYLQMMRALNERIRRGLDVKLPETTGIAAQVGSLSQRERDPPR